MFWFCMAKCVTAPFSHKHEGVFVSPLFWFYFDFILILFDFFEFFGVDQARVWARV